MTKIIAPVADKPSAVKPMHTCPSPLCDVTCIGPDDDADAPPTDASLFSHCQHGVYRVANGCKQCSEDDCVWCGAKFPRRAGDDICKACRFAHNFGMKQAGDSAVEHRRRADSWQARTLEAERENAQLRGQLAVATKGKVAWEGLYNERNRLWRDVADRLDAVNMLLERNGCDCDCDHHPEEHEAECDRCLACEVAVALTDSVIQPAIAEGK